MTIDELKKKATLSENLLIDQVLEIAQDRKGIDNLARREARVEFLMRRIDDAFRRMSPDERGYALRSLGNWEEDFEAEWKAKKA